MSEFIARAFGTEDAAAIVAKKLAGDGAPVVRASRPRVTKIKMSVDECKALCDGVGLEYLEGYEGRVFQYCLTDETVDRYGDVVIAKGCNMKAYMQQPVVLAFHNGLSFPVGNIIKLWHDEAKSRIMGWVLFFDERLDRSMDQIAETAFRYASSGAMKAGSIGFNVEEGGAYKPEEDERKARRMPMYGIVFAKWELMEFSVTPVPANPNATQQRSMDLYTRDGIEAARDSLIDDADVSAMVAVLADMQAYAEIAHEKDLALDAVMRPYPNEHACRLAPPEDFDKFRRTTRKTSEGKEYSVIFGRKKDTDKWAEQAYRYPVKEWTVAEAEEHCKEHDGILFEPAANKAVREIVHSVSVEIVDREALALLVNRMGIMCERLAAVAKHLDEVVTRSVEVARPQEPPRHDCAAGAPQVTTDAIVKEAKAFVERLRATAAKQ